MLLQQGPPTLLAVGQSVCTRSRSCELDIVYTDENPNHPIMKVESGGGEGRGGEGRGGEKPGELQCEKGGNACQKI